MMQYTRDPFGVTFQKPARTIGSWKEEIYAAARTIAGRSTKPLWVLTNGGVMGEIMCRAFVEQDIHVSIVTMVTGPEQEARTTAFRQWCKDKRVPYETVLFDADYFYNHYIPQCIGNGVHARRVQTYFKKYLLDEVDARGGTAVLGGGALHFRTDDRGVHVVYDTDELIFADVQHERYFFATTPELLHAYLDDPLVAAACLRSDVFRVPESARYLRALVARSAWPLISANRKMSFYDTALQRFKNASALLADHSYEEVRVSLDELRR